jgi:hypothetical protein
MENQVTCNAKVSANRRNAKKSTGPNDTSSTRLNATKHGLLSEGITELDDADGYRETLHRLQERYSDELDNFLVERIALFMVRLRRAPRLEAELVTSVLHPPVRGGLDSLTDFVIDPGQPALIDSEGVEILARYQRYESANENKLYRAMNQLERIRRIQQGEQLPAPVSVDVALHPENPRIDSTEAIPFEAAQTIHDAHQGKISMKTGEQPRDESDSTTATGEPH